MRKDFIKYVEINEELSEFDKQHLLKAYNAFERCCELDCRYLVYDPYAEGGHFAVCRDASDVHDIIDYFEDDERSALKGYYRSGSDWCVVAKHTGIAKYRILPL